MKIGASIIMGFIIVFILFLCCKDLVTIFSLLSRMCKFEFSHRPDGKQKYSLFKQLISLLYRDILAFAHLLIALFGVRAAIVLVTSVCCALELNTI